MNITRSNYKGYITSLIIDIKIYSRLLYNSIAGIYDKSYVSRVLYASKTNRIQTISGMMSNLKALLHKHRIITPFCNTFGYYV